MRHIFASMAIAVTLLIGGMAVETSTTATTAVETVAQEFNVDFDVEAPTAEAYGRSYFGSLYGTPAHCSSQVVNNTCFIGHRHKPNGDCNSYVEMRRSWNRYVGWVVYRATYTGTGSC